MRQNVQNGNYSEVVVSVPPLESTYDATANDSDKTWVVPLNEMWKIHWIHVILISTATVGNRAMTVSILDGAGNEIFDTVAAAVQAASLTRHYSFLQGTYREAAFASDEIQSPIPVDCYLGPGYTLRVRDRAAVDASADDMTVSFQYQRLIV